MRLRGMKRWIALITMIAVAVPSMTAASAEPSAVDETVATLAMFEGQLIDISQDWGEATACAVSEDPRDPLECFRTEAEMNAHIGSLSASVQGSTKSLTTPTAAAGSTVTLAGTYCSASLRLYSGTSYTGSVLWLSVRHRWLNLANYGFNQRTSSFKIGACSSYFADYSNGGGGWYPTGSTQAYDVSSSMISGWNNDVSSVYIT